jgi:hypothetical protein
MAKESSGRGVDPQPDPRSVAISFDDLSRRLASSTVSHKIDAYK